MNNPLNSNSCESDDSESVESVTCNIINATSINKEVSNSSGELGSTTATETLKEKQNNNEDDIVIRTNPDYDMNNFIDSSVPTADNSLLKSDSSYYQSLLFENIDHGERFFQFKKEIEEKDSNSNIQSIDSKDIHLQFPIRNTNHQYVTVNSIDYLTVGIGVTVALDNSDPTKYFLAEYGDLFESPFGLFICATRYFIQDAPFANEDETIILNFLIIPNKSKDSDTELYSIKSINAKELMGGKYQNNFKLVKTKETSDSFYSYLTYLEDIKKARWLRLNTLDQNSKAKLVDENGSIPPDNNNNNGNTVVAISVVNNDNNSTTNNKIPIAVAYLANDVDDERNERDNKGNDDNDSFNESFSDDDCDSSKVVIDSSDNESKSETKNNETINERSEQNTHTDQIGDVSIEGTNKTKKLTSKGRSPTTNSPPPKSSKPEENTRVEETKVVSMEGTNKTKTKKKDRSPINKLPLKRSTRNKSIPDDDLRKRKKKLSLLLDSDTEEVARKAQMNKIKKIENKRQQDLTAERQRIAEQESKARVEAEQEKLRNKQKKIDDSKRKKEKALSDKKERERIEKENEFQKTKKKEEQRLAKEKEEAEKKRVREEEAYQKRIANSSNDNSLALVAAMTQMGNMFEKGLEKLSDKITVNNSSTGKASIILPETCNNLEIIKKTRTSNKIESDQPDSRKRSKSSHKESPPSSPSECSKDDKKKSKKRRERSPSTEDDKKKKKKKKKKTKKEESPSSKSTSSSSSSSASSKGGKSRTRNKIYKTKIRFG